MTADTKDKATFACHARRHMTGAVYKTYDAMLAMALSGFTKENPRKPGEPLIFKGRIRPTLANHTNTSLTQLHEHVETLLAHGWLIPPPEGAAKSRWARGRLAPVNYVILDHSDYVANKVGSCPAYAFAQEDDVESGTESGDRLKKSDQPLDFAAESPKGRIALLNERLAGKLPGNTWEEIKENARKRGRK